MGGGAPCPGETLPCVWGKVHQETGREGAGSGTGGGVGTPGGAGERGWAPSGGGSRAIGQEGSGGRRAAGGLKGEDGCEGPEGGPGWGLAAKRPRPSFQAVNQDWTAGCGFLRPSPGLESRCEMGELPFTQRRQTGQGTGGLPRRQAQTGAPEGRWPVQGRGSVPGRGGLSPIGGPS